MKRSLLPSIVGVGLALFFTLGHPAQAQIYEVGCDSMELIGAILFAESTPVEDTLNLADDCVYTFTAGDALKPDSALPRITTPITINGNGASLVRASGSPDFRLVYISEDGNLTLDNVTVTGGRSAGSGGGINNSDGRLTVTNSTLSDNRASYGGGLYSFGTLTVINSTLSGNIAAEAGGGIYNADSTLTVTNSTLTGNSAAEAGGGIFNDIYNSLTVTNSTLSGNNADLYGGGIFNVGTATVIDSTLSGNNADNTGGGIYAAVGGTLTVTDSILSGNAAAYAAGIFNSGTLTATGSTFSGNNAISFGGAIYAANGGMLTVIGSAFSGNSAGSFGGGLFNDVTSTLAVTNSSLLGNSATYGGGVDSRGMLTVTNSIVSGNSASYGGGLSNSGMLTVTSSTVSGNSADFGGGIRNFTSSTLTLANSIVWGNESQIQNLGAITVTYSDIEGGGFTGAGNLNLDPLFVSPISHMSAPTTAGNYRLQRNSPVTNVGSNAALPADSFDLDGDANIAEPIPHDRDGNPRIAEGTVDLGAYEIQPGELLANGGFEIDADLNKIPDGWAVKNGTSDKRLCKLGKPHTGLCAFQFKGGVPEKAQLSQTVNLSGVTVDAGDTLALSAFFSGNNPTTKVKFMLRVTYAGNPTPVKSTVTVTQNAAYTQIALPVMSVTATVEQIKVTFKHKSTAGKVLIDDASLIHTPLGGRRSSDILPLPLAPSGFRGGN